MPSLAGLFGSHDHNKSPKDKVDKASTPPKHTTAPHQVAQENFTPSAPVPAPPAAPVATARPTRPNPPVEHFYLPHLELKAPIATLAPTHIANIAVIKKDKTNGAGGPSPKGKSLFGSGGKMTWGRGDRERSRNGSGSSESSNGAGPTSPTDAQPAVIQGAVSGESGNAAQRQSSGQLGYQVPEAEDECLI